jgi:RNase adapter protein RapZ
MTRKSRPNRILLVTGMSGAGKSTALKALEDMGWEVVDNLPLVLLDRLLATKLPEGSTDSRPLAVGIDSRTRGFDANVIVERIRDMRDGHEENVATLFVDCSGIELERRFSETRRRHPLALDRPASDGIARERELLAPLRRWADHVIDTTASTSNDLRLDVRTRFSTEQADSPTLSVPRNADLVFDMRFLSNPHWDPALRPLTGLYDAVGFHVRSDPAFAEAVTKIEDLLRFLLPRYRAEGKAYVTVAFGCTGGRHRSVYVTEHIAQTLRDAGFSPTVSHRDLGSAPQDAIEGTPNVETKSELKAGNR